MPEKQLRMVGAEIFLLPKFKLGCMSESAKLPTTLIWRFLLLILIWHLKSSKILMPLISWERLSLVERPKGIEPRMDTNTHE